MKEGINIGVIGSRRRIELADFFSVRDAVLSIHKEGDWLVSGGCPKGGDEFAERMALAGGMAILIFFPNWEKYKKAAGFVRNGSIAENSDILIACVANDRKGGTEDTIKKFLKMKGKTEAEAIDECILILV